MERKNHLPLRSLLYLLDNDLSRWEGVEVLYLLRVSKGLEVNSMREISSLGGIMEAICVKKEMVSRSFSLPLSLRSFDQRRLT